MDVGVVDGERAAESIEFGSTIANRYTILRPDKVGSPNAFVCRELDAEPLRSVWALRPRYDGDADGQAFLSEMARVQKLEHPQLRKVLDFGREPSGILYAVFDPLEIRDLSDVLEKEWPLNDERVVWLMCQLLATLEVAHAAGLSHGDLRPENVLVRAAGPTTQNEELLLCGLGLANSARYSFAEREHLPQLKLAPWLVGTPGYAAPEQLRGEHHDARSDVYGAGLIMFQLLTRTLPFAAGNDHDIAFMQCFTPPPPPSGYARVSPALEAICLKALTKTPDMRYHSANEMRAALLAAQAARNSRPSGRISVRSTRSSQTRISSVPAEVVVTRISEAGAPFAGRSITAEPIETNAPPQPERPRARSAALLVVSCGLAVLAATVMPDLRLHDTETDKVAHEAAPAQPARALSAETPRLAAAEPHSAPAQPPAAPVALVVRAPVAIDAAAAQLPAAQPLAAPNPKPTAPRATARPARVRIRSIEKNVVAAEVSHADTAPIEHGSMPMALVAPASGSAAGLEGASSTTAPENEEAVPARIELPALEEPQPIAEAHEPALAAPKPIILSTISPPAPASEPSAASNAPAAAREISVVISDGASTRGAASKGSLRGALNQAAITRCYRNAIQGGAAPAHAVNAHLEISTNMSGHIISAKLSGSTLPDNLVRCVEEAARLGRVREADTGEVRASFELTFRAR
jgi:serine/threonine protein kinase